LTPRGSDASPVARSTGEVRLSGFYSQAGVWRNDLEDYTLYTAHSLLLDSASNAAYTRSAAVRSLGLAFDVPAVVTVTASGDGLTVSAEGVPPQCDVYVFAIRDASAAALDADEAEWLVGWAGLPSLGVSDFTVTLTTFWDRRAPRDYSPQQQPMASFSAYTVHVVAADAENTWSVLHAASARTLDRLAPALAAPPDAVADYASSNFNEVVYSLRDVVDQTDVRAFSWLMQGDAGFADAAAARAFAEAVNWVNVVATDLTPGGSAEIRMSGFYSGDGWWCGFLEDDTEYTAQTLLLDSAGNAAYARSAAVRTHNPLL
jgi:hypothetical protein